MLSGGHGYEVLEDDTKVLEIKNGPYYTCNLISSSFELLCQSHDLVLRHGQKTSNG